MYRINQYVTVAPIMKELEQYKKVSPNTLIQKEHIKQHINSFVTHLDMSHMPTDVQKNYVMGMLYRLKETDSIDEATHLIINIESRVKEMKDNILEMREEYFAIINDNTDAVYGVLKEKYTTFERDNYIKALVLYSNIVEELKEFSNRSILKRIRLPLLRLGSGMYGDLKALEHLRRGEPAELPHLTYNRSGR